MNADNPEKQAIKSSSVYATPRNIRKENTKPDLGDRNRRALLLYMQKKGSSVCSGK
jgi:hypothetical protein